MPRRRNKQEKHNAYGGYKFANLRIPKTDKEHVEGWIAENETEFFEYIDNLLVDEYTIKLSNSEHSGSYIASLSGTEDNEYNPRVILTSHASTIIEAIGMMLYKHIVLCDQKMWPIDSEEDRWG